VDLAKEAFHFSLVGIQGNDIVVGNGKLALALFWQQVTSTPPPLPSCSIQSCSLHHVG
jgi:hypothetical protein